MKKRYLTLDDLYNYYEANSKRARHFSSKNSNEAPLIVQSLGTVKFEKDAENNDLTLVSLQACHSGINLNHSSIDDEIMEKALPSFLNKPILAYIHEVDGELQFYDHRMHQDDEGEIIYDEYPVGIIPESGNPHMEYDEEKDKNYVVVDGYLFNEYSPAAEILEREGECSVSVELNISELSFNPKDHLMIIEDFTFSGVTLLGKRPDGSEVKPGMSGSNIKLGDFSNQNSVFSDDKVMTMLEKLNRKIDDLTNFSNKNFIRKEDKVELNKELFEQLLAKYNKTEADITFDYSELDDDALSAAFAKAFEEKEDSSSEGDVIDNSDNDEQKIDAENSEVKFDGESSESGNEASGETGNENSEENGETGNNNVTESSTTETNESIENIETESEVNENIGNDNSGNNDTPITPVTPVVTADGDDDQEVNHDDGSDAEYLKKIQNNEIQYSATFAGQTKTFAKSLNEIISALTELVNTTYGESDNAWYSCEVYEDKTVRFDDWWMDKHYIQKYTVKDNEYKLKGERTEVFARYLTQEEIDALEGLKSKFEEVSDKLSKFEAEPEKMSILKSSDYSSIAESDEFVAFKAQEAHFDLSVDEVRAKADQMLLNAAKAGKVEFSKNEENITKPKIGFKMFPINTAKKGTKKYGNLLQDI